MQTEQVRANDLLRVIRAEYLEMPGLQLTIRQAQRLWGLDRDYCSKLLNTLVDANFLSQRRDGTFIRVDGGPKRVAPRSAA